MSLSTMFLLGAGASHKAGIKGIESMTNSFVDEMDWLVKFYSEKIDRTVSSYARDGPFTDFSESDAEEVVRLLKRDIFKKKGKFDIELLLEALNNLDNKDHILYSILNYPKKYSKYDDQYKHLKNILIQFIRTQCENMSSVNYLHPLIAFKPGIGPLDVFTLNYDGTIEKMCKEHDIIYADGFKEDWNPEYFLEGNIELKLYKLHGSLYWYKTEKGKYINLPIKNVNIDQLTYFMDEKISETLIWPMITKDYSTGPFPWLMEELRKKLRTYDLCIVLGYSFRDDYIKQIVLDEMRNNTNLWLLIVDHNSKDIKERLSNNDDELQSRVITMDNDIEKALSHRILINIKYKLQNARNQEVDNMNSIIANKTLVVNSWDNVFTVYRQMRHYDRVEYLVKYLLENFEGEDYEIPSLQWKVFDLTLLIGIKHFIRGNYSESLYWLNRFNECSIVLDWAMQRDITTENELVSKHQLPKWAKDKRPHEYSSLFSDLNNMIDSLGICYQMLDDEKDMQKIIVNYISAMEIYTNNIESGESLRLEPISELLDKGLVWSGLTGRLLYLVENKKKKDSPAPIEEP